MATLMTTAMVIVRLRRRPVQISDIRNCVRMTSRCVELERDEHPL